MTNLRHVYVVDDDRNIRDLLCLIGEERGFACHCYASGEEFLAAVGELPVGCVLLDVRLPGMSGLDVQAELARRGRSDAIITITGHGYVDTAVESMKMGAVDFLEKPFSNEDMFAALDRAAASIPV